MTLTSPRKRAQQPDDSGESDLEYFLARPLEHMRVRSPFPNEFGEFLPKHPGKVPLVIVTIDRNPKTGEPGDRGLVDHVLALRAPPREKKPKPSATPASAPLDRVSIIPPASPTFDDGIPF